MSEDDKTTKRLALVASKGTLDMAYPPLIMATTAAAMGWEAGIFFTFYGLNILDRSKIDRLKVAPLANPAAPPPLAAVPIGVPNFLGGLPGMTGIATAMMKSWMRKAKMPTIRELLDLCIESDVQLFACATTMGVMGVKQEQLIAGAKCAGATSFLSYAADADVSLFV
jgi:peroxiredoxin family protein